MEGSYPITDRGEYIRIQKRTTTRSGKVGLGRAAGPAGRSFVLRACCGWSKRLADDLHHFLLPAVQASSDVAPPLGALTRTSVPS